MAEASQIEVHSSVGLKCSNFSDDSVAVCMHLVELGFFSLPPCPFSSAYGAEVVTS